MIGIKIWTYFSFILSQSTRLIRMITHTVPCTHHTNNHCCDHGQTNRQNSHR